MVLPRNGFIACEDIDEKEAPVSQVIDEVALDCWALSHNGNLGEKTCDAYQQAASYLEAASGILKKVEA